MLQLLVEPVPMPVVNHREAGPVFLVSGVPSIASRMAEVNPDVLAEALFSQLLAEFLTKQGSNHREPRRAVVKREIPLEPAAEGKAGWKSWVPGKYAHAADRPYDGAPASKLDYGTLFDYLGTLRSTEHVFQEHYRPDETGINARCHNDGQSLSDRDIDREMVRDRNTQLGLGFMDHGDPFLRERYELYKRLMGETMKLVRQILATH